MDDTKSYRIVVFIFQSPMRKKNKTEVAKMSDKELIQYLHKLGKLSYESVIQFNICLFAQLLNFCLKYFMYDCYLIC